jgi:iron complex transport system ATP-binding protein
LTRWNWEGARDEALTRAALAALGLTELAERDVRSLSGGERQRLAIATLLAQQPRLYLLDEPLAHLDLNHQMAVLELFGQLAVRQQAGVAMVLHDVNLARRFADRVLLLAGNGDWRAGTAAEMLTAANLSALYGHPLRQIDDPLQPYFVPK